MYFIVLSRNSRVAEFGSVTWLVSVPKKFPSGLQLRTPCCFTDLVGRPSRILLVDRGQVAVHVAAGALEVFVGPHEACLHLRQACTGRQAIAPALQSAGVGRATQQRLVQPLN